jgi:hypothetical protein
MTRVNDTKYHRAWEEIRLVKITEKVELQAFSLEMVR